jgi:hypothetical protein
MGTNIFCLTNEFLNIRGDKKLTRNRGLLQFKILEVSKDNIGNYAKIEAEFPDGVIVIRCGLDFLTYGNLKNAVSTRIFDTMPGIQYKYKLLTGYRGPSRYEMEEGIEEYFGFIECVLGKQTKEIMFK